MKPVIQQQPTGCGIAAVAAVTHRTYLEVRRAANSLGIRASDDKLWSETFPVRRLLRYYGVPAQARERPFRSWRSLPDLAVIAIKWHRERGRPFWHWAVFVREGAKGYVLDSKKTLRHHVRTDFGRMKPKWFIALRKGRRAA